MTDQPASLDSHGPSTEAGAEPCEDCAPATGRAILIAFAFAAFAAFIAADFATGGKLTAWTAGLLAGLRRQASK